jgi:hypothetical protein
MRTVGAFQPRGHGKKSARATLLAGKFVMIGLRQVIVGPGRSPIALAISAPFGTA